MPHEAQLVCMVAEGAEVPGYEVCLAKSKGPSLHQLPITHSPGGQMLLVYLSASKHSAMCRGLGVPQLLENDA